MYTNCGRCGESFPDCDADEEDQLYELDDGTSVCRGCLEPEEWERIDAAAHRTIRLGQEQASAEGRPYEYSDLVAYADALEQGYPPDWTSHPNYRLVDFRARPGVVPVLIQRVECPECGDEFILEEHYLCDCCREAEVQGSKSP